MKIIIDRSVINFFFLYLIIFSTKRPRNDPNSRSKRLTRLSVSIIFYFRHNCIIYYSDNRCRIIISLSSSNLHCILQMQTNHRVIDKHIMWPDCGRINDTRSGQYWKRVFARWRKKNPRQFTNLLNAIEWRYAEAAESNRPTNVLCSAVGG